MELQDSKQACLVVFRSSGLENICFEQDKNLIWASLKEQSTPTSDINYCSAIILHVAP